MRISRLAIWTIVGCSALLGAARSASAQTEVTLGATTQLITFFGESKSEPNEVGVTLGACNKGQCRLTGTAQESGKIGTSSVPYEILSKLGSVTATLVNATLGTWKVSESAPMLFELGKNGSLLTGDLNLLTLQNKPGSKSGEFDVNGVADLTITGGSLADDFTKAGGVLQVSVVFYSTTNIMSLLGTGNHKYGTMGGGVLTPTPEPNTVAIFLVGSGILLIGTIMKRKRALPARL